MLIKRVPGICSDVIMRPKLNHTSLYVYCMTYTAYAEEVISLLNSLVPGRFQFNFRQVLVNGGWGISYEIALRWMPLDLTDDKSTLVQVMAWCRQATSHYLNQCWPRSMSPNGVTRPQWVDSSWPSESPERRYRSGSTFDQVMMAFCLRAPESMLIYHQKRSVGCSIHRWAISQEVLMGLTRITIGPMI